MMDFIKNYWTEILSVIGAAAWLPIVFGPIIRFIVNRCRKVQATILDSRILTNGKGVSVDRKQIKNGTILMIVVNLFITKVPFFAKNISVKVKLKNGAELNSEILDFSTLTSNNDDGSKSGFSVPDDKEFNISRTIQPDTDNVKYIAILVESANFSKIDEIENIEIRLFCLKNRWRLFSKKIILNSNDFPTFNSANLISVVEHFNK